MAENILSLEKRSIQSYLSSDLTPQQKRAEALVSSCVDHVTDGYALAGMVGGGLIYRLGRLGTLAVGSRLLTPHTSPLTSHVLHLTSVGIGFTGEVFAFEAGQRALRVGIGGADPNSLRWGGENGLSRGLMGAALTLGPLKAAGVFAQGQNIVVQHLFQDSAMVLAHHVSNRMFTRRGEVTSPGRGDPAPTLAEQLIHAEATLWQMNAGISLVHGAFPTIGQMDRSLDLSIRSRMAPAPALQAPSPARGEGNNDGELLQPLLAATGNGRHSITSPKISLEILSVQMDGVSEGAPPIQGKSGRSHESSNHVLGIIEAKQKDGKEVRPSLLFDLALAYSREKNYLMAIETIQRSLKIQEHPRAYCELGHLFRKLDQLEESTQALQRAIELEGGRFGRSFFELGITLRLMHRFEESEKSLRRAIQLERGGMAGSFSELGRSLRKQGKLGEAEEAFRRAIEISHAKRVSYLFDLAVLLGDRGNFEEAQGLIFEAQKIDPNPAGRNLLEWGLTLYRLGKMEEAEEALRKAVQLGIRKQDRALVELGIVLRENQKMEESEKSLQAAVQINPNNHRALVELGILYRYQGLLNKSLIFVNEAIRLEPHFGRYHCEFGITLRQQGYFDFATRAFEEAIQLEGSSNARSFGELGITLARQGRSKDALNALQRAIHLDPENSRYLIERGILLRKMGDFKGSEISLKKARSEK